MKLQNEKTAPSVAGMKASISPAYESDSNGVGEAMSRFKDFVDVEIDIHGFKASPAAVLIEKKTSRKQVYLQLSSYKNLPTTLISTVLCA